MVSAPSGMVLPLINASGEFVIHGGISFPSPSNPVVAEASPYLVSESVPLDASFLPGYLYGFLVLVDISSVD